MAIDRTKISRLAEAHMAMGRVDRAIEEFLKLIDDRSDDYNLLNRVGDAYLQAGKVSEAMDMFKKAGSGYERSGFNAKATAVFKKAHRIAMDDVDIAERLAELYRQTNMVKEAIQIHIEVAEVCTRKGLIKRALEAFAKVVDLDPKNLKNKVKLADLYNKEGLKENAVAIYLEVAEALALEQMHAEAYQILERAKTMVSTPQVFLTHSRLCVIQKDLAGAAKHLREGLDTNPRSADLLDALAEVELQSRNPERALEALAQVPQLPQKSLQLCERALRDLVRDKRVEEGLRLFKPIGRDFARRGIGEAAARALRTGLQGSLTAEAWLQLGEIAHQGGGRDEEVDCLRHAFAEAGAEHDQAQAELVAGKLQGLGVPQEELSAPFAVQPQGPDREVPQARQESEQDAALRMQLEKLQRDARHFLNNRYLDKAMECFNRILDLDPANNEAITAIADIHRASGMLTKVQMHYVRTAEKLTPLGFRKLAVDLLDRAEAMFPGSTRLYRRTLGLLDVPAAQPLAPAAIPMAAPLDPLPLIELGPEAATWSSAMLEGVMPPLEAALPLQQPEYEWAEFSEVLHPAESTAPGLFPPAAGAGEDLDLAGVLSDIDFQLDYGSPEEAMIEVDNALAAHPGHPELARRKELAEAALRRLGHEVRAEAPKETDFAPSFFDLTDVLGDALLDSGDGEEMHDATRVVEKIQSVDELFNAFREGVEQQVKLDDYDTHYQLGIAYKEMQLLDPAIEEFKSAMRDPERTLECCSMLAICEQSQGNLEAAAQWLKQGIEAPGFPPEDAIGLRYDLGTLYRDQNLEREAIEQFKIVHDQDPYYREVAGLLGKAE